MSSRRQRLQKLTDLRKKELDDAVGELGRAREREEQARQRLAHEVEELEQAHQRRSILARQGAATELWTSENDWLELRETYRQAAHAALSKAELARHRAFAEVMAARAAVKKLEVLGERLRREELRDEERKDQRLHDELTQARSSRGAR
ncbi:MAG: flagellar FliJ family protein [Polyangiaceae bacterium]